MLICYASVQVPVGFGKIAPILMEAHPIYPLAGVIGNLM